MDSTLKNKLAALLVGGAVLLGVQQNGGFQFAVPKPAPDTTVAVGTPDPQLSAMVTSKKVRAELRNFFKALAVLVESGELTTTENFRTAYRHAVTVMKANDRLPSLSAMDPLIQTHFKRGLGVPDTQVDVPNVPLPKDSTLRRGLVAELYNVSASFQ